MKRSYNKPYSLPDSFSFALRGVYHALTHERNLRIHFASAGYALYFSRYYALSKAEYALLLLSIGFVITCEMVNTAIETTVDLETPSYNSLAKIAKDVAAGAVLVSALTSVGVAFLLFWDMPTIHVIAQDITGSAAVWAFLVAATIAWVALPQKKFNNRNGA